MLAQPAACTLTVPEYYMLLKFGCDGIRGGGGGAGTGYVIEYSENAHAHLHTHTHMNAAHECVMSGDEWVCFCIALLNKVD